jgi:arginine repressor
MSPVSPATKAARHAQIVSILEQAAVRSQEELADWLARRGVRVTQTTLSRDLEELGAVRLRDRDGALIYALPGEPGGPGSRPGGLAASLTGEPGGEPGGHGGEPGGHGGEPGGHGGEPGGHGGTGGDAPGGAPGGYGGTGGDSPGAGGHGDPAAGGHAAPGAGGPGSPGGPGRPGAQPAAAVFREQAGAGAEPRARLARAAAELLVSAEASANLVIVRTPAGAAQFLASVLDHARWSSILGTVAGDDTVLVIARDPAGGDELARSLLRLAERRT